MTGVLGGVTVAISARWIVHDGLPDRIDARSRDLVAAAGDIDPLQTSAAGVHDIGDPACVFGNPGARAALDFALIGDRHAAAIRPAPGYRARSKGRAGTLLREAGCPILDGAWRVTDTERAGCEAFTTGVLAALVGDVGTGELHRRPVGIRLFRARRR